MFFEAVGFLYTVFLPQDECLICPHPEHFQIPVLPGCLTYWCLCFFMINFGQPLATDTPYSFGLNYPESTLCRPRSYHHDPPKNDFEPKIQSLSCKDVCFRHLQRLSLLTS